MFLDYYHLREQPFGVTPDPRYLYLSRAHREALASLYYGVTAGRGFMALIAEPGMGKTTLLVQLLERLRKSACVAFLFQTQCNSRELLRYMLADMGLESGEQDPVSLHAQLNQALVRMARAGRRFVLVIDEAQNLDSSVLETVRLLSDFETPSSKLVQIILSGQPQLAEKLASPSLVQLRQRIAILSRLEPFSRQETDQYIGHRLQIAGHGGRRIFTSEAMDFIAAASQGIPRNINNLCFNALSLGCALRRATINRGIVEEAFGDSALKSTSLPPSSAPVDVPPASVAKPRSAPGNVVQRASGRALVWSAVLGAACFLTFLLLFPSVRGVCRNSFSRAFGATKPVSKAILHYRPAIPFSVSNMLLAAKAVMGTQASDSGGPLGKRKVTVVVKPGETFHSICVDHFGRFDRNLAQQFLALNPQITDLNHIEVGQRIVLPGRSQESSGNSQAGLGSIDTLGSTRN